MSIERELKRIAVALEQIANEGIPGFEIKIDGNELIAEELRKMRMAL